MCRFERTHRRPVAHSGPRDRYAHTHYDCGTDSKFSTCPPLLEHRGSCLANFHAPQHLECQGCVPVAPVSPHRVCLGNKGLPRWSL